MGCSTPGLCPSPTHGVYSNSGPLSRWCHPTISSSVVSFSSHLQSFPASGSFQISRFFILGGQSIGVSASVFPMNIQDWFPLGWTGWLPLGNRQYCGERSPVWHSCTGKIKSWEYFRDIGTKIQTIQPRVSSSNHKVRLEETETSGKKIVITETAKPKTLFNFWLDWLNIQNSWSYGISAWVCVVMSDSLWPYGL